MRHDCIVSGDLLLISLLPNGRALASSDGLTPSQYRAIVSQPYSYFSKKNRSFSFIPTPYGCSSLLEAGLEVDAALASNAGRWNEFAVSDRSYDGSQARYAKHLNKSPWPHQDRAIEFFINCPSVMADMGLGVGKSLTTIATLDACSHKRTLILSPKPVVNVWPREFRKHSLGKELIIPLDKGTTKKKVEYAQKWWNVDEPVVFVINYESAIQPEFTKWAHEKSWDCVVCDEIHKIKSPTGKASKFCADLNAGHKIGLTGTMIPHDPLDVFAQYRFLDPAIFGSSFTSFKKKYCKLGYFNEVEEFIQLEELHERINLIRHHVPSTVLGLPPITNVEYRFDLSSKVRKFYDKFKQELIAEIDGGTVVADNVLVRGVRLQQITSGFFIDDNTGDMVVLDDQPKLTAFKEWFEYVPRGEKAVVFTRFTHDLDVVLDFLRSTGLKVAELSGRHSDLTSDATYPEWADVLVANIASGGVGIDLTAANYGCYYSISWNRAEYDQSIARLNRPGQTKHVTFAHLVAEDTVDTRIYEAFEEGRDLVNAVLTGLKNRS